MTKNLHPLRCVHGSSMYVLVISLVEHMYICRSTDPSLVEIHQEMGELLDKQDLSFEN